MVDLSPYLTADKGPSHITGLDQQFQAALAKMLGAVPDPHNVQIYSGYRSPKHQARLWRNALKKYGSPGAARKWVAPPGRSFHNKGLAADLRYSSPAAREWVHSNANQYGLHFPLGHENWHIELAGTRGGGGRPSPPQPSPQVVAAMSPPQRDPQVAGVSQRGRPPAPMPASPAMEIPGWPGNAPPFAGSASQQRPTIDVAPQQSDPSGAGSFYNDSILPALRQALSGANFSVQFSNPGARFLPPNIPWPGR